MAKTNKRERVTVTSIAQHLGLSVATVSYVMNGKTEQNGISEQTAERVRTAATKMGYIPNDLARSLRRQQTSSIGVILSDLQQGWADRTLKAMLSVLDSEGYIIYLSVHFWDPDRERRELRSMMKRRMEAIITVPMSENAEEYKLLAAQGIPLLFLQDEIEECPEISFCMWDARSAARSCVQHLIDSGRERIAFVGVDHFTPWLRMRLEGYREAMEQAGLEVKEDWILLDHREAIPTTQGTQTHFGNAVRKLIAGGGELPDAFLAMNDAVAMTTFEVLRTEFNYRVPEDFAVMGMGDLAYAGLVGLSSAREPVEDVGRSAARVALDLIKAKSETRVRSLISSSELVVRTTTAPSEETNKKKHSKAKGPKVAR